VQAQGGDPGVIDDPAGLPQAAVVRELRSPEDATVTQVDPRTVGHAITALGGGRRQAGDAIDPSVGFRILAQPGMKVGKGQLLGTVHARTDDDAEAGLTALRKAIRLGERAAPLPLISHRLSIREITAAD
jgi:thymidine phosphorylase